MDVKAVIKDAAFDLFENRSFHQIRVEDILQRAHISRRTFYRYYRDKYELMHEYFSTRIGDLLIGGYDGTNWFEQTRSSFDYFLSHASFLANVKNIHGQDSLWDYLLRYVNSFYTMVKEHNKGGSLSGQEALIAEGIAALSVHFYRMCVYDPKSISSEELTKALSLMIPVSYRLYEAESR